jgi:hypothetical protein
MSFDVSMLITASTSPNALSLKVSVRSIRCIGTFAPRFGSDGWHTIR